MKYPFLDLAKVNEPYYDELVRAAERVIRSGRYIGGEEVEAFETELSQMLKAPYIIGVSNGLDALRLILRAYIQLGVFKEGDEVIYPANTFIASVLAISDAGLVPVPVDIDERTLDIDTSLIEAAVTERTKAIMPVHLYGNIVWDDTLVAVARRYSLKIIEDSAQALGAYGSQCGLHESSFAGALGDAGAISFYPTKNVGALGDAGAVVTFDGELARVVRTLANYGSDRQYHNIYRGFNCRIDPIQAAMLRVKLPYLAKENSDRTERALAYQNTIDREGIYLPYITHEKYDQVWHQFVIRVVNYKRDRFREMLEREGVGTAIHYAVPPHKQPCYSGMAHGDLPVTERIADELVSLPIATGTSVADAMEIGRIINRLDF